MVTFPYVWMSYLLNVPLHTRSVFRFRWVSLVGRFRIISRPLKNSRTHTHVQTRWIYLHFVSVRLILRPFCRATHHHRLSRYFFFFIMFSSSSAAAFVAFRRRHRLSFFIQWRLGLLYVFMWTNERTTVNCFCIIRSHRLGQVFILLLFLLHIHRYGSMCVCVFCVVVVVMKFLCLFCYFFPTRELKINKLNLF